MTYQKGFTLVEMLVAMAIFAIVSVAIAELFIIASRAQQRAGTSQKVQSDARVVLNQVTELIRNGKINYDYYSSSISSPVTVLALIDENDQEVVIQKNDDSAACPSIKGTPCLEMSEDGGYTFQPISPENLKVSVVNFYIDPASDPSKKDGPNIQPRVTFAIGVQGTSENVAQQGTVYVQATVSSRIFVKTAKAIDDNGSVAPDENPPDDVECGNGTQESGEGCDDGNIVAGDGCSATCQVEGVAPIYNVLVNHTINHKDFVVTWSSTGATASSSCQIQLNSVNIGSPVACLAETVSLELPWNDGHSLWGSTMEVVVVPSPGSPTLNGSASKQFNCTAQTGSQSASPAIDEDCDGNWDNTKSAIYFEKIWTNWYLCQGYKNINLWLTPPNVANEDACLPLCENAANNGGIAGDCYGTSSGLCWLGTTVVCPGTGGVYKFRRGSRNLYY